MNFEYSCILMSIQLNGSPIYFTCSSTLLAARKTTAVRLSARTAPISYNLIHTGPVTLPA